MFRFGAALFLVLSLGSAAQAGSLDGKWKLKGGCLDGRKFSGAMSVVVSPGDAAGKISFGPFSGDIVGGGWYEGVWTLVVQPRTSQYVDIWRAADDEQRGFFMASIETGDKVCQVYGTR